MKKRKVYPRADAGHNFKDETRLSSRRKGIICGPQLLSALFSICELDLFVTVTYFALMVSKKNTGRERSFFFFFFREKKSSSPEKKKKKKKTSPPPPEPAGYQTGTLSKTTLTGQSVFSPASPMLILHFSSIVNGADCADDNNNPSLVLFTFVPRSN